MESWSLFVTTPAGTTEHRVVERTRVGRGAGLEVRVAHPHVSRHHFTVHRSATECVLEHAHPPDNNPRGTWVTINTFVNGEQVMTTHPLSLGDVITLKKDERANEVTIALQPSVNPSQSPDPSAKPWWKFW